jgi:hypothetical protein
MFNPAFIFIFEEENEILNQELFIKKFLDFMGIVSISIMSCMLYGVIITLQIPDLLYYIWSLISIQQWLDFAYVLSSIGASISILLLVNDVTDNFDREMTKMVENLKEKEIQIAELELMIKEKLEFYKK